jgi:PsbP-like protein
MKSTQITCALLFLLGSNLMLNAQQDANWETVKDNLYNIRYPKTDWIKRIDSLTGASLMLATKATNNKPYDRDFLQLRILENDDKLYGDLDAYEAQYKSDSKNKDDPILFAKRIKKGIVEFHEKVEKNHYGKIKRRIKERRFFINQKVYELIFDASEVVYDKMIGQVDSIFDSFLLTDAAATVVDKWLVSDNQTYKINYPSNWILAEMKPQHVDFMLNKPKKSNDRGYWDNIYLMINTFKESTPELGNFTQRATEQLKATLKNATIIQSTRKKTDKFAYQEVISEGDLGKNRVKMKQWHIVKGKKAYTLTYTARVDGFDELGNIVAEIFSSFYLK